MRKVLFHFINTMTGVSKFSGRKNQRSSKITNIKKYCVIRSTGLYAWFNQGFSLFKLLSSNDISFKAFSIRS